MMDAGLIPQEADAWLAGVPRSARGSTGRELPRMKMSSHDSVLASLRCLSALPSALDVRTNASGHAPQQLGSSGPPCQAQAAHYLAFLDQKVAQAAAHLRKKFAHRIDIHGPKQLPAAGAPSAGHEQNAQPPPSIPRAQACVIPAGLPCDVPAAAAVVSRKRPAAEALSDGLAPMQTAVLCSSLHATPNTSDDGATPTAPAAHHPTLTDACWGASSGEPAVDQVRLSSGSSGGGGRGSGSAASVMRPFVAADHLTHPLTQQQHMEPGGRMQGQTQQQIAVGPVGTEPLPAAKSRSNPHVPNLTLAPGAGAGARYPTGPGGNPARDTVARAHAPGYGGVLPPQRAESVPFLSRSDLQGQQAPEGRLSRPLQHQPPKVGMAVAGPTATAIPAGAPQGGPQAPPLPASPQPPALCPIPAASLTLQQLLNRTGHGTTTAPTPVSAAARQAANPSRDRVPNQRPGAQPSAECIADSARSRAAAVLRLADPQLRATLEATAAAASARHQARLAELPSMDRVLQCWPLGELTSVFSPGLAGRMAAGDSGVGTGPLDASVGDLTLGGGGRPGLRFLDTTLPRRRSAVEIEPELLTGGSREPVGTSTVLQLTRGALGEALPPDACQTRQELWELFLMHVNQVETSMGGPLPKEPLQGTFSCPSEQRHASIGAHAMDGADGWRCGCGCHGQGPPTERPPLEVKDASTAGTETNRSDSDEPDVYISHEGIACLASLSQKHYAGGDWRLPFVVVPRPPADKGPGNLAPRDAATAPARMQCEQCTYACPDRGCRGAVPATIYFGEPLPDADGVIMDSWTRVCLQALSAAQSAVERGCEQPVRSEGMRHGVGLEADGDGEDCPCCQQDEWLLGDMSLLVLSHSRAGLVSGSGAWGGGTWGRVELQVLALAGSTCAADDSGPGGAQAAAVQAATRQSAELACHVELLSRKAETLVMVVDPSTGSLLAQHRLNHGALMRLAREHGNMPQNRWQLAQGILTRFRQLPPGPYMLSVDTSRQCLELRGVQAAGSS